MSAAAVVVVMAADGKKRVSVLIFHARAYGSFPPAGFFVVVAAGVLRRERYIQ